MYSTETAIQLLAGFRKEAPARKVIRRWLLRAMHWLNAVANRYFTSINMESALHPQTILALDFLGAPHTPPLGAPLRLRITTKLGFKNPKSIFAMEVTNKWTGGYWANQGYKWFSGS